MTDEVNLIIDDVEVTVPSGTLVVDAAKRVGIDIPVFCYHPKMDPVGMCRMCLVEVGRPAVDRATREPVLDDDGKQVIQFAPKLDVACTLPVSPGMVIRTTTEKVKAGREDILEFLLTSHPLDCPICDKGGECPLQNLTMAHGPGTSRFIFDEKAKNDKHVPLGELIYLDRERCIQCARCTRFADEIAGDAVIGFFERGRNLEIITYSEPGFDSYWSGNTTDICPVGALTTADFRFNARPWELKHQASLCQECAVGCNTSIHHRRDGLTGKIEVKRIMPRQNEQVNEIWMCDKGRFGHHYATSGERLTTPLLRKHDELVEVTWDEAIAAVTAKLDGARGKLAALAADTLSNEDLFALKTLVDGLDGRVAQWPGYMAGGELVQQVGVATGTNLGEIGEGSTIVVVASDLEEEAPIWFLRVKQSADRRGANVIVLNGRTTKLDRFASESIRYAYGEEVAAINALGNHAAVREAENLIVLYGSDGLGLEASQQVAQACANLLMSTGHVGRANNGLIAVWPGANTQGAWDLGITPPGAGFFDAAEVVLLAGADPVERPDGVFTIVTDLLLTDSAASADVVLPVQSFVEREGTLTNGERRVQRYYNTLPSRGQARPEWQIFQALGKALGIEMPQRHSAAGVFVDLAASVPDYAGLSYQALAEVVEQFPLVGEGDFYYGGTSYKNEHGLGVKLAPAAERGTPVHPAHAESPARPDSALLAASTTLLYDRGARFALSELVQQRVDPAHIALNSADAERLGIADGDEVSVSVAGQVATVVAWVNGAAPEGVALIPQDLGGPTFRGLLPAEVTKLERALA